MRSIAESRRTVSRAAPLDASSAATQSRVQHVGWEVNIDRKRARLLVAPAVAFGFALIVGPMSARADEHASWFSCRDDPEVHEWSLTSDANLDLFNGLLYFGGVAALDFGVDPERRWSRTNGFDTGIRDGLRLGSSSARKDADRASDFTLGLSSAILPAATIGAHFHRNRNCREAWDMATDTIESLGLTLFVTEAVKLAAGRERPFARTCDGSPPSDARCNRRGRLKSFVSGHASIAAAGAGVACSHALRRNAWGDDPWARRAPCAVGVAAALATGVLRVSSDRHWGSDVLLGLAVGATVGWFDTWGPFDLLTFETRGRDGRVSSRGAFLPSRMDDALGARLYVSF